MKRVVWLVAVLSAVALALAALEAWRAYQVAQVDFQPWPSTFVANPPIEGMQPLVLRAKGGLKVAATFVAPKNGMAVILAHGAESSRAQMWPDAVTLANAGFGVLAFDWPGHGESEGTITLTGPAEREAFTACVDFLAGRDDVKRIGAYGFSNGAALVTLFGALDPRVVTVLAAGAWTDALEQTAYEFRHWGIVREWPAVYATEQLMHGNLRPIDFAQQLRGRRTLFVAGEADPVVPSGMSKALAEKAGGEARLFKGGGHSNFREFATPEPWNAQLIAFFSQSL